VRARARYGDCVRWLVHGENEEMELLAI